MKSSGFEKRYLDLTPEACKDLPSSLSLWGNFENYSKINTSDLKLKMLLLYYYGELAAGLIFYEKKHYKYIKAAYSPNLNTSVPFGHIYIKKQDSLRAQEQLMEKFVEEITNIISQENYVNFTLCLHPEISDIREFIWGGWKVIPRFTYILNLEEIRRKGLSEFVGKKIRNIIKNTNQTLIIKPISAKDFYLCYRDTYERQGKKPAKTKEYFSKLEKINNISFLGAFENDELSSGIVVCESGEAAYFITSGSINKYYNNNGVTHLLYHYIGELLKKDGQKIKIFDFVGANTKNVSHFKANFNPKPVSYFMVKKQKIIVKLIDMILTLTI